MTRDRSNVAVVGFAVTGRAITHHLNLVGKRVVAIDDFVDESMLEAARDIGVRLTTTPTGSELDELLSEQSVVVVSPGIPPRHPIFESCTRTDTPVTTEIELAFLELNPQTKLVAVTGTNGKTTVVTLIEKMLNRSGVSAMASGNIGTPMIECIAKDLDAIVVETSSFQLSLTQKFRPDIAVWLNLTPDHLDAHQSMEEYISAKARIWTNQVADDVAIANAEDPIVMGQVARTRSRQLTFGLRKGDFSLEGGKLIGPGSETIIDVANMARSLPHDILNALASSAATVSAGGSLEACEEVLAEFDGLSHRIELIGSHNGVKYFDDSKATTPSAVVAALEGFDSVVLIAGGRNKGLDLTPITERSDRIKALVAIGEAADEVVGTFKNKLGTKPVRTAASMEEAVTFAEAFAEIGDAVILSPGCASFDWYRSYKERGDDFARQVSKLGRNSR
jgi:UDP-N-acetylmuramoylalanine--D-glutamate ligase